MGNFRKFLISKYFWIHLGIMFVVFLLLLLITIQVLKVYTNNGQKIAVPLLHGKSIKEVEKIIKDKDLRYKVIDSTYVGDLKPGVVVSQHPESNEFVKEKREVSIIINSKFPKKVTAPYVINAPVREAISKLVVLGFQIGRLNYVNHPHKNLVLNQFVDNKQIKKGQKIYKGSVIDLEVAKGNDFFYTKVPDLFSKRYSEIKLICYNSYLNIGVITKDNTIKTKNDLRNAFVYKQEPALNTELEFGQNVDVWLTLDQEKIRAKKDTTLVIDYEAN